jgi:hypothetical protein
LVVVWGTDFAFTLDWNTGGVFRGDLDRQKLREPGLFGVGGMISILFFNT